MKIIIYTKYQSYPCGILLLPKPNKTNWYRLTHSLFICNLNGIIKRSILLLLVLKNYVSLRIINRLIDLLQLLKRSIRCSYVSGLYLSCYLPVLKKRPGLLRISLYISLKSSVRWIYVSKVYISYVIVRS